MTTYQEMIKQNMSPRLIEQMKEFDRKIDEFSTKFVEVKMLEIMRSGRKGGENK